jgi:methylglyoxal synthase
MKHMRIALIAHDRKKDDMVAFVSRHNEFFRDCDLVATRTTGGCLISALGLSVACVLSGPFGGDLQIGAQLVKGAVSAVFFLRDPMTPMPHEADITALLRLCDVYNVPYASNLAGAELIVKSLKIKSVLYGCRYGLRGLAYQRETYASQVMEQSV